MTDNRILIDRHAAAGFNIVMENQPSSNRVLTYTGKQTQIKSNTKNKYQGSKRSGNAGSKESLVPEYIRYLTQLERRIEKTKKLEPPPFPNHSPFEFI